MATSVHLFVSPTGEALPRWLEAFPAAKVVPPTRGFKPSPSVHLIWLHLDERLAAATQLIALRETAGALPVVVLANRPNDDEALTLFALGIRGYCNAQATKENLRLVAKVVMDGGLWVGETLLQRLLKATHAALAKTPPTTSPGVKEDALTKQLQLLTEREREVAEAIARGASNKEVAGQLAITARTVKAHVGSIFEKLKIRDRLHLALMINRRPPA